jgi:LPXTG-motif cell wall-anchored protein
MNHSLDAARRFGRIGLATLVLAFGGLATIGTASSSSAVVGSPLPVNESFADLETVNAWTALGTAQLNNGSLQLTPSSGGNGAYVLDTPIPADGGLEVEFDWENIGTGDGSTVFLMDGAAPAALGGGGGALGYAYMPTGYLAVGFDEYNGQIRLLGSGEGIVGFPSLRAASYYPMSGEHRARFRLADGAVSVDIKEPEGIWRNVFRNVEVATLPGQAPLPATLMVGFSASTGGAVAKHLIRNVEIREPGLVLRTKASKNAATGEITMHSSVSNLSSASLSGLALTATGSAITVPAAALSCVVTGTATCPPGEAALSFGPNGSVVASRIVSNPTEPGATITSTVSQDGNPIASDTISINGFPTIDYGTRHRMSTSQESMLHVFSPRQWMNDVTVTSAAALHGTITPRGAVGFEYLPDHGFLGVDTITYTVSNGVLETTGNTVSITVVGPNSAPTATLAPITFAEDGEPFVLPITFTDPDGDTVYITGAWADEGNVTINDAGTEATYTPRADYNGTEYIGFEFTDDIYSDGVEAEFEITPVADQARVELRQWWGPTYAYEDAGEASYFPYSAFNPDNENAVTVVSASATHGTIEVRNDEGNYILYTPNENFFGTETLTFTLNEETVTGSIISTVSLPVIATPDEPTATATAVTTNANTAVDIPVTLADADGDTVSIVSASADTGIVTIVGSTLHYMPASNASGTDTITYEISDGVGVPEPDPNDDRIVFDPNDGEGPIADNSADATFTVDVTINAVDGRPTATASPATTLEDTPVDIAVTITDLDSTTGLTISAAAAAYGTVTIDGTTLRYTPAANYNGSDTITYSVTDGTNTTVGNTVIVTITAVNDDPVAPASEPSTITATSTSGATVTFELTTVNDVDGDTLDVMIVQQPAHGTVTIVSNAPGNAVVIGATGGRLVYTPTAGFAGTDTFTYSVSDGNGGSYERVVQVTVTAPRLPAAGLPTTGSDIGGLVGVGTLALMVGAGLVLMQRRRKV